MSAVRFFVDVMNGLGEVLLAKGKQDALGQYRPRVVSDRTTFRAPDGFRDICRRGDGDPANP